MPQTSRSRKSKSFKRTDLSLSTLIISKIIISFIIDVKHFVFFCYTNKVKIRRVHQTILIYICVLKPCVAYMYSDGVCINLSLVSAAALAVSNGAIIQSDK